MKEFITKNFSVLLIAALILFLWNKGVFTPLPLQKPTIVVVSDTTNKEHAGTVTNTSKEVQYIPYKVEVVKEVMKDSTAIQKIVEDYLSTRVQQSKLDIPDSLGHVTATTYTTHNKVDSTKWDYKINERTITNTITIREPYQPKNQLYYGFELSSPISGMLGIQEALAGVALKNKKDNILKVTVGYNFITNKPVGSIGYYKKLSFHK